VVGYHLHPEDGGSMVLRNVGILPWHYTASHPRRPRLESSPPRRPQISHRKRNCSLNKAGVVICIFLSTQSWPSSQLTTADTVSLKNLLTHWKAGECLGMLLIIRFLSKYPVVTEPGSSSLPLQESTVGPRPAPVESTSHILKNRQANTWSRLSSLHFEIC